MDSLIYNGDFKLDLSSQPISIKGPDAMIQSFLMMLSIPSGRFILDPSIGSNFLENLSYSSDIHFKHKLLDSIRDVASSFPLINIENVDYSFNPSNSSLSINIFLSISNVRHVTSMEVLI